MVIGDGIMTNSSDSDFQMGNTPQNLSTTDINQKVGENQGQAIGQTFDSVIVNTLNIYQGYSEPALETKTNPTMLGENPYKGLEAFEEEDRDRFFGRDAEIKGENGLLKRFQDLRDDQNAIRILPVYGASGSGKSSLVKAGLVPILRDGLKEGDRIVLMKPSEDPIGELAKALAHDMIDNPFPVKEISDFKARLLEQNDIQEQDGTIKKGFDGLHQIINSAKHVKSLILVIDQFEEVYTYQALPSQRDAFIENLLYAASHRSQKVSVILTMRIDFVGKTHEYPRLNKLFASPPGVYVPVMQRDQLAIAISEPAKGAGHIFTEEIIDLLLEQSQGQEGALPLLQFALTQIWEGLSTGIAPIDTLRKIDGVGGALAKKAQEAYDSLKTDQEKQIVRSIFLKLILLNDDNRATRRRVAILDLLIGDPKEQSVREVIAHFTQPKVRILVTSAPIENPNLETVEIAHEALIDNWEELKGWLRENKKAILQRDEIERLRYKWESQNKSKEYLLQDRLLRDALEFQQAQKDNPEMDLSNKDKQFVDKSRKKQRQAFLKSAAIFLVFPAVGTLIATHFFLLNLAQKILTSEDKECKQNREIPILVQYMILIGQKENLERSVFCNDNLSRLDLSGATLWKANFRAAQLVKTKFYDAYLVEANFQKANLHGTDFTESNLEKANFEGSIILRTDLATAKGLQQYQLEKSVICQAKLPKGFTVDPNRDCKKLGI